MTELRQGSPSDSKIVGYIVGTLFLVSLAKVDFSRLTKTDLMVGRWLGKVGKEGKLQLSQHVVACKPMIG